MTINHLSPGKEKENLFYRIPYWVRVTPMALLVAGIFGVFVPVPMEMSWLIPDRVWALVALIGLAGGLLLTVLMLLANKHATGNIFGLTNEMKGSAAYKRQMDQNHFFSNQLKAIFWLLFVVFFLIAGFILWGYISN